MEMTRFEGKMTDFLQEAVALHPQGLLTLHKREDAWLNLESELGVVLALMEGPVVNRYKQACYGICPCLPGHTQSKPPSPPLHHQPTLSCLCFLKLTKLSAPGPLNIHLPLPGTPVFALLLLNPIDHPGSS